MFDFSTPKKRKTTKAQRVKKLAARVKKLEAKKALQTLENNLKKRLQTLTK